MKEQIGDYRIIKQIGSGPLGSLYLAEHRFLKKNFALKILPEEIGKDRQLIGRLSKEISLLSNLDHPNIVKMHNVSEAEGVFFLITDCIVDAMGETTNLLEYFSSYNYQLSEHEIVKIAHQVGSALDYAHGKGTSHLGLKPSNINIGKGKDGIELRLSDFGLTRVIGTGNFLSKLYKYLADILDIQPLEGTRAIDAKYSSEGIDSAKLSKLHTSYLQSYLFLAPEQKIPSKTSEVGKKSDVYAFGVLLYYLLMGNHPEGFFPLPSQLKGRYKLPWDHLLVSCLQPEPEKRPEKILGLLEELLSPSTPREGREVRKWPQATPAPAAAEASEQKKEEGAVAVAELPKPVLKPSEIKRPEYESDPASVFQIDTTVAKYHHEKKAPADIEPILTEMVIIEGGTFNRGSNHGARDEMPNHKIALSSFAIDVHAVTNEQFVRFLEVMGGEKDANNLDIIRLRDSRIKRSGGKLSIESGYAKHPVVGVTWYGAVAYSKWVGKRLPTEAEWEVAAAGGLEECPYPMGKNIERSQANYFSSDTTAVMSYPPNQYGLYDMVGNVYEWCQDWYEFHYYNTSLQEPNDPKGPLQGVYRVLRGGCWKSLKEDMRISHRHRNNPGTINRTYGFRCVCDVN